MNVHLKYSQIKLAPDNPQPLYLQLVQELKHLIQNLPLNQEEKLLSERRLADILQVHRTTVSKAYRRLEETGLIRHCSSYCYQISHRDRRNALIPYPNIGIILPRRFSELSDMNNGMTMQYIKGMIDSAMEQNCSIIMLKLPDVDAKTRSIEQFNRDLTHRLIGVIHLGERNHIADRPLETVMNNTDIPQILISAFPKLANIGAVVSNPSVGARALAEQLKILRHRSVGFVLKSPQYVKQTDHPLMTYETFFRPEIFRTIFGEYGLECGQQFECSGCDTYSATCKALKTMQKNHTLPTCFWCINDLTARWVVKALRTMEISVPGEISVVGFDGLTPTSQEHDELTTIGLPFYNIGSQAVRQLIDFHQNGMNETNRIVQLPTFFIVKQTLAVARSI